LLLARTNERLRDISVRVALGAPRLRLFLQTLGENIVIVVLGSLLALLFAGFGLELITIIVNSLGSGILAFWMQFHLDGATLVGVLLFSVITVTLTGAIPIWRIVNGDFNAVMRDGTRGALGLKAGRFNRALVVTSISIVTLLMVIIAIAGSLFYPEMKIWTSVPNNSLFATFSLDPGRYDAERQQQFLRTLGDALMAEPSVSYVGIGAGLGIAEVRPETGDKANAVYAIGARITVSAYNSPPPADGSSIAPGAPALLEGRNLNEFDQAGSAPVAFISQELATGLWPGESALNKRIRIRGVPAAADTWREVVGVYGTNREGTSRLLNSRPENVQLPFSQVTTDVLALNVNLITRSQEQIGAVKTASSKIFTSLDSGLQVQFTEIGEVLDSLKRTAGIGINLAMITGLFIFLVAIAGIFGLTQNAVQMATQEIGTRRALGATDKSVALTFIRKGSRQLVAGFLIALLIAAPFLFILNEIINSLELSIRLPLLVTCVVLILLYSTIITAIFVPIRRILRMEPAEALHYE
jgi:ABC-type antimicrobial peptide transport system permease subunit